jgi:hypothetical protein
MSLCEIARLHSFVVVVIICFCACAVIPDALQASVDANVHHMGANV